MTAIGIVGPGRAGVGFGLALSRAGHQVVLHGRRPKHLPIPLELTWGEAPPWLPSVDVVLLAVPDDTVRDVAAAVAETGAVTAQHTVLHVSGVLDHLVLDPLAPTGAALGSLHPFQTLADPLDAPQRLDGATAAVEGMPEAVEVATTLARSVGLRPITISREHKVVYHAAAVFASNHLVVLAGMAEELLQDAGLSQAQAREAIGSLMAGALENVRRGGPAPALTGPVVRGDLETVRKHLAALPEEAVRVYRSMALAALRLAELRPERRQAIEAELSTNN